MLESLRHEWLRIEDVVSEMHLEPVVLPQKFIVGTMLPTVAVVTLVLTVVFVLCFQFVDYVAPLGADARRKSKLCYQTTNILFNFVVGGYGTYLEYWVLPALGNYQKDSLAKILYQHEELYLVSALQLGYQFWAIPVGIFWVGESREMILHHLAVVVSTSMSGFLSIGFRYYTPFFYGVMELSSIPLSVMNSFKENPEWMKRFPKGFGLCRAIFASSFLCIRVFLCAWKWPIFLRDNFFVFLTREMGVMKLYFLIQWGLAAFLAYLQLFWATLIIRGILGIIFPRKAKDRKGKIQ